MRQKKGTGKYDKYLLRQSVGKQYVCFDLYLSRLELRNFLDHLPQENEVFKLVSPAGGWSSCSLVMWIATPVSYTYLTAARMDLKTPSLCVLGWNLSRRICASRNNSSNERFSRSLWVRRICESSALVNLDKSPYVATTHTSYTQILPPNTRKNNKFRKNKKK